MSHKVFIRYSEEDIRQAREADILDVLSRLYGYTFHKEGREWKCNEHNSLVINANRQRWYWNSRKLGGNNALDWLQTVERYDFTTAVGTLINKLPAQQTIASSKPYRSATKSETVTSDNSLDIYCLRDEDINRELKGKQYAQLKSSPEYLRYKQVNSIKLNSESTYELNEKINELWSNEQITTSDIISVRGKAYYIDNPDKLTPLEDFFTFRLPPKTNGRYSNVYQYLIKTRCISKDILEYCFKEHIIYQDYHRNCVFVGFNDKKEPCFASQRSTNQSSKYRPDVAFSDKRYSFNIPATTFCDRVYVFESPIDLLSHATLNQINSAQYCQKNDLKYDPQCWLKHNRLSLSGSGETALDAFLERHKEIKKIACCLDNDETGQRTAQKIYDKYTPLGYLVTIHHPRVGKDYNNSLCSLYAQKQNNVTQQTEDDIILGSETISHKI